MMAMTTSSSTSVNPRFFGERLEMMMRLLMVGYILLTSYLIWLMRQPQLRWSVPPNCGWS